MSTIKNKKNELEQHFKHYSYPILFKAFYKHIIASDSKM